MVASFGCKYVASQNRDFVTISELDVITVGVNMYWINNFYIKIATSPWNLNDKNLFVATTQFWNNKELSHNLSIMSRLNRRQWMRKSLLASSTVMFVSQTEVISRVVDKISADDPLLGLNWNENPCGPSKHLLFTFRSVKFFVN